MNPPVSVDMAARLAARVFSSECRRSGRHPQMPCYSRTLLPRGARDCALDMFTEHIIVPAVLAAVNQPSVRDIPTAEVTITLDGLTVRATCVDDPDSGEWLDLHFAHTLPHRS